METKKNSILIVDDMPENIDILSQALIQDYNLFVATNGQKALDLTFSDNPPDLILLDILLPDINGYDVCQKIKENQDTKEIPIIFITAKSSTEDVAKGFDYGAVDYIVKPYNMTELTSRVRTHVELKNSRQKMKLYNENLKLINIELSKSLGKSDKKMSDLIYKINKILEGEKNLHDQLKIVKKLVPLIAINDLGNLKVIAKILEESADIINTLVKEPIPEEDYLRVLSYSIEPLKTVIANIDSVIRVLINIGIITKDSIRSIELAKTSFYESLTRMMLSGKLSHENFKMLLKLASFSLDEPDASQDGGVVFF